MAALAGLIGGFAAMVGVIFAFLIPLVLLGLGEYKGPGSHAIVYAIVGAGLGVFVGVGASIRNWILRKRSTNRDSEAGIHEPARQKQKPSAQSDQKPYNTEKWTALLRYDEDIARAAEQLRSFGDKWFDILASDFLALNDKQYLPSILEKIIAEAKKERGGFQSQQRGEEQKENQEGNSSEKPRFRYAFATIMLGCIGVLAILGGIELYGTWPLHEKLLLAQSEIRKQLPIKYKSNISL
jgi:hypothetical protein